MPPELLANSIELSANSSEFLVKSSEWVSFPELLKFHGTQLSHWQSPWSYWWTLPELLGNTPMLVANSLELVVGEPFVRYRQNLSWLTTNFNCVRILLSFRRTPLTRWQTVQYSQCLHFTCRWTTFSCLWTSPFCQHTPLSSWQTHHSFQ